MIRALWGQKIGMSQKFASETSKVIPVTVVNLGKWFCLQRKTTEHDGYEAIQIGLLRNKYVNKDFSNEWIKDKKNVFLFVKEVRCDKEDSFVIGSEFSFENVFSIGDKVSVTGVSIGKGFQGCVKRYGFTGGRGSHGDKLGRRPGSLSGLRTQGRVFKGKRMPGHTGADVCTISNIEVVDYSPSERIVVIKGSIPGKSGSLVQLKKG
jgi:large subunit ribosomal protein L3